MVRASCHYQAKVCVCVSHQITELSTELADERNTGEAASQLLESETSERLCLDKDMKDLQVETAVSFNRAFIFDNVK